MVLVAASLSLSLLARSTRWPVSPSADQMGRRWVASWVWGAGKATRLGLGPHRRRLNRRQGANQVYRAPYNTKREQAR